MAVAKPKTGARFRLVYRGAELELAPGVFTIGRDAASSLALEDPRASRRHAELRVTDSLCIFSDVGSSNGTWVNGEQLKGARVLQGGDHLTLAQTDLHFLDTQGAPSAPAPIAGMFSLDDGARALPPGSSGPKPPGSASPPRAPAAEANPRATSRVRPSPAMTAPPAPLAAEPAGRVPRGELLEDDATLVTGHSGQVDAFQLFGRLAEEAFAEGDEARAAQILTAQFRAILAGARRRASAPKESLDFMVRFALRLAVATLDAQWIDAVFRAHAIARRPVSPAFVDDVRSGLRRLPPLDRTALREYLDTLRAVEATLTPTERFVIQRVATLEQFVRSIANGGSGL